MVVYIRALPDRTILLFSRVIDDPIYDSRYRAPKSRKIAYLNYALMLNNL